MSVIVSLCRPSRALRARVRRPPSWCGCRGRSGGVARWQAGLALTEESLEPRCWEPPWSRGQACHQYPHEDGRSPSLGKRCHITQHITTKHTLGTTPLIFHFLFLTTTFEYTTSFVFVRAVTVIAWHLCRVLIKTECWWSRHHVFAPSCCRSGSRANPSAGGRSRGTPPEDHTRLAPLSLALTGLKASEG